MSITPDKEKMTVVYCRPGRLAEIREIGTDLADMQAAVQGDIEAYYCFGDEPFCIVCNEEGKYNGSQPNRAVYGEDKKMMDIVFGPFFICGLGEEDFISLTKDQQKRFRKQFERPEHFYREGQEIKAVPYRPERDHVR